MSFLRKLFFYFSYLSKPPWDTGISPPELLDFLGNHPAGRALDLGCGTGTNAITLAKRGWQVTGVDFMPQAIQQARKKAQREGLAINFRVGDVTRLEDLAGPFDLILDIGCYHNLSPQAKRAYQANLARWLAPEGAFLLYGFLTQNSDQVFGIHDADLAGIVEIIPLALRSDSTDRGRPSTWLLFQLPGKGKQPA
jgi:SAM-dependent methyltransferase